MDEEGYFQLEAKYHNYWEVKAGCLIRHHVLPRHRLYCLQGGTNCLISPDKLDTVRIILAKYANGKMQILTDHGKATAPPSKESWTGITVYQINGPIRKELGMFTSHNAKKVARQQKHYGKKKSALEINERGFSFHERKQFQQAKIKELRNFFKNGVRECQTTKEADATRTLTARMLLKWSKNADGTARAKARLVVRGYAD